MPDRSTSRSFFVRVGWLLAELAVVFIGVYGAFLLDSHREAQRLEVRRDQIITTLCAESNELKTYLPTFTALYDSFYVQPFLTALEAGERPVPEPLDFYAGSFDTSMWETALQSGGLDALDYDLIQEAQAFYSSLGQAFSYTDSFLERLDLLVLPHLERGETAFYEPGTTDLRQAYIWYPASLRQLHTILDTTRQRADSLHASLGCEALVPG